MNRVDETKRLLAASSEVQRREIFTSMRREFSVHPLETKLDAEAGTILDAVSKVDDFTLRGILKLIPEAAFKVYVVSALANWRDESPPGYHSFDFLLRDAVGGVRVRVKTQCLRGHVPMMATQVYQQLPADMYMVETQRIRGGKNHKTGEDTRPYKFGEFDVLAVSMHPSTRDWSSFMYTVAEWLLPRPENKALMLKFQPVSRSSNDVWTDSIETCIGWFRSKEEKTILD
ncbi:MAG TPA: hypothetical protein VKV95_14895 [Terriglobia bacterium]|nr:hypothetical protein [Terriglobia bacterium]